MVREIDNDLIVAAWEGNADLVRQFIAAGADVNAADGKALFCATAKGHADAVAALLDAGAKIEGRLLAVAIHKGFSDTLRVLLERGASVEDVIDAAYGAIEQRERHIREMREMVVWAYRLRRDGGFHV